MRVIDIYNNGGSRTTAELMLTGRLEALSSKGVTVGVMVREGEMSRRIGGIGSVDTTDFGFFQTFTLYSRLSRLMGRVTDDTVFLHVHNLSDANIALSVRDIERGEGRDIYVVYEPIGEDVHFDRRHVRGIGPRIDLCLFHTEEFRDVFMEMLGEDVGGGLNAVIIPPGFDIKEPMKREGRRRMTLIWGGRLTSENNLLTLMEAMVKLRERGAEGLRLIVAGQGKARYVSPILKYVRTRGLEDMVDFVGDRALDEDLLKRGDIGVLTNGEYPDNDIDTGAFLSAGLPIIVPSYPDEEPSAGDFGYGMMYDYGDSDSLAGMLLDVYTNKGLYRRLTEMATLYALKMRNNRYIVRDLMKAYKTVMR